MPQLQPTYREIEPERGRTLRQWVTRAVARRRAQHVDAELRVVRRIARRAGYHVVPANYYSPIPELEALDGDVWARQAAMPGVELDLDAQLELLRGELAPYLAEFDPPAGRPGDEFGFHRDNRYYGSLDADVLYAMVRRFRPPRIVELGSGYTTLVIERARRRIGGETPGHHVVFDPYPSCLLASVRGLIDLEPVPAVDVPLDTLASLRDGELLVIDTTHTVKPGGEVVRLVLEVLPRLAPGVLVHIHDFFRPFEYPRMLYERYGLVWQEHYLVQALLAGTEQWDILLANHALARLRYDEVSALVPSLAPDAAPSALWIRRRGARNHAKV
jgi:hypothetical protein